MKGDERSGENVGVSLWGGFVYVNGVRGRWLEGESGCRGCGVGGLCMEKVKRSVVFWGGDRGVGVSWWQDESVVEVEGFERLSRGAYRGVIVGEVCEREGCERLMAGGGVGVSWLWGERVVYVEVSERLESLWTYKKT